MKDYKCDQYEYTAKQRTHINRHKLSVHEGMWYHCQKCNYQGKHINNVHNDLQNLKYCSYIVDNSDALDQPHTRTLSLECYWSSYRYPVFDC